MGDYIKRARAFWGRRSRWGKGLIVVAAVLVGLAILGSAIGEDTSESSGTTETTTEASTPPPPQPPPPPPAAPEPKANVFVVAKKSFCTATGVDDAFTGDGHVQFFLTIRNSGKKSGSITITPVRYYDDGTSNKSPLDTVSVDVKAGRTWKGKTEAHTYEAHSHEITDCALIVDGDTGNEIRIRDVHL